MHSGHEITLSITQLGGMGDGVAEAEGLPVFVPYTVPGDRVRAVITQVGKDSARAELREVLEMGPERISPPCWHFGTCGGCALQHIAPEAYLAFKRDILQNAVRRAGYDTSCVRELISVGAEARRRAEFGVTVHKGQVSIGFSAARSNQIEDISECAVLRPAIVELLSPLREVLSSLKKPSLVQGIAVTETAQGLDLLLTCSAHFSKGDSEKLLAFAEGYPPVVRFALRVAEGEAEPFFSRGDVTVRCGQVEVELPPDAFLQAAEEGGKAITAVVTRALSGCRHVADIYSGLGTYSFPLAEQGCRVSAFEGSESMVAALFNAARRQGLDGQVTGTVRDLYRQPLTARELSTFDGVVINPPRNGAGPQAAQLAESGVGRIVMVSCNPATFARDAAQLKAKGYALTEATPIDQFLWSAHLELVAVFAKP